MILDISPLRKHRDYRLLYTGQLVSFFGSMITYVAVPYQIYALTKSSFAVGWTLPPVALGFGLVIL